jgi:hypothetical protein
LGDPEAPFRRLAGGAALVATVIGAISGFLFLAAADFRLDGILEPHRLVQRGAQAAELLRYAALTDMLGYYLFLVPLFVAVGRDLGRYGRGMGTLITVSGVMYATIGSIGAVVLGHVGARLLQSVGQAGSESAVEAFIVLVDAVVRGMWQTLEIIPAGAWALGSGMLLRRHRRGLGTLGIAVGLLLLIAAAVRFAGVGLSGDPGTIAYVAVLAASLGVYVVWLALLLMRGRALVGP